MTDLILRSRDKDRNLNIPNRNSRDTGFFNLGILILGIRVFSNAQVQARSFGHLSARFEIFIFGIGNVFYNDDSLVAFHG